MQRFPDGSFAQWLVSPSLFLIAGCSAQEEQSRDDEPAAESSRGGASEAGNSETSQREEQSGDEAASAPEWTGHDRLTGPVANDRETVDVAWEWMVDNYEALVDKLPEIQAARLPRVGEAFCSGAGRDRVKSFFGQEAHRKVGTERKLAQALSTIDQCRALETRVAEDVRKHLSK